MKKRSTNATINVRGTEITVIRREDQDYISLTDMLKAKDGDFFISDWLRNRNTVEFLGIWETVHNPDFNSGEFAIIRSQAGLNSYKLSVKEWVEKTNAIGLRASAGRYGGTYAHHDIAFEFGMWISPEFKIYLIKEFQRLKEDENRRREQRPCVVISKQFRCSPFGPLRAGGCYIKTKAKRAKSQRLRGPQTLLGRRREAKVAER